MVYVNPDSALRALEAIDSAKLTTPRAVALHSLLLSQARHKCYVDLSDAESLASAARYFRRNGDLHHAMLAQYYRAETLYETADYANAVRSVMEAEDLAEKLDDKYYLGIICELMADLNYSTYNFPESIDARRRASRYFLEADSLSQCRFSIGELAQCYYNNSMPERSVELLDSLSALEPIGHYNDENLEAYIISGYISPLLDLKEYERLDSIIGLMDDFPSFDFGLVLQSDIIRYYVKAQRFSDAEKKIDLCINQYGSLCDEEVAFQLAVYDYYDEKKDYKNALKYIENAFRIHNSRIDAALNQTVAVTQRDYEKNLKRRQEARAVRLRNMLTVIVLFVCILGVIIYLYNRERMRRKDLEINSYIRDIQQMGLKLVDGDEKTRRLQILINDMFESHFVVLNNLCDEYFDVRDTRNQKAMLYNKIQDEISKICSQESISSLERMVDDCMDGIVSRLKSEFPNFKPVDITICTLVFAGFSARTICLIIDKDLGYYYNKRKRIKDRILQSDSPNVSLYLSKFDKSTRKHTK